MDGVWLEWLDQLGVTIDSAQMLAWRLAGQGGVSNEARELYSRLEAARTELESLRVVSARPPIAPIDADWLQKLGWSSALTEPQD